MSTLRSYEDSEDLLDDLSRLEVGTVILVRGWPHRIVDAGPDLGHRIAAFRPPYGETKEGKARRLDVLKKEKELVAKEAKKRIEGINARIGMLTKESA